MTEWQPIETAPRDGTEILCYDSAVLYGKGNIILNWENGSWVDFYKRIYDPTHWMPNPKPPETKE